MASDSLDDNEVNTADSNKLMWLLKLPKAVNDVWSQANSEQDLGYVTHNKVTGEISLSISGIGTVPVPRNYNLSRHDVSQEPPLIIFNEAKGGKITIEGKVECKAELTPVSGVSDEYRQFVKNRTMKSNIKTRQSQTLNTRFVPIPVVPKMGSTSTVSRPAPIEKERNLDKRVRGRKEDVLDRIFSAFAIKPYWDLTGLTNHTDQPQVYLKEILAEVCIKHTSGPHRQMYELKAQYKDNTTATESSTS